KLLEALAFGSKETDREIANTFGNLIAKNAERTLALRSDENAAPGSQIMADDVCDRVRLAGSGRSLHDDSLDIGALQSPDDRDLLLVERLGEKELTVDVIGGRAQIVN